MMSDAGYLVRDMFVLGPIAFLSKYCGRMFGRTCTTTKCAANARTIIAMGGGFYYSLECGIHRMEVVSSPGNSAVLAVAADFVGSALHPCLETHVYECLVFLLTSRRSGPSGT